MDRFELREHVGIAALFLAKEAARGALVATVVADARRGDAGREVRPARREADEVVAARHDRHGKRAVFLLEVRRVDGKCGGIQPQDGRVAVDAHGDTHLAAEFGRLRIDRERDAVFERRRHVAETKGGRLHLRLHAFLRVRRS